MKQTTMPFSLEESTAKVLKLFKLNLFSKWGTKQDQPKNGFRITRTGIGDHEATITFEARSIDTVNTCLENAGVYPPPTKKGVLYGSRVDLLPFTTSDTDASFRVDEPIVASLQVRHPRSNNITTEMVMEAVGIAVSGLFYEDGTSRIPELITGCTEVKHD